GACHALGEMPGYSPDDPAGRRCAEDGGREQHAHSGTSRDPPPGTMPGARLVLVLVDLAAHVLGDNRGVIGADEAARVSVLDDLVVILRGTFVRVCRNEDERAVGLGHATSRSGYSDILAR